MNVRAPNSWLAHYPEATLPLLHRLLPAYDRIPLSEALSRQCALFREGADSPRFVGVFADPLNTNLQRWAEARSGERGRPEYLVEQTGRKHAIAATRRTGRDGRQRAAGQ